MKAIELLKKYDVNPKDFMVVLVDSNNIHVFLDGDTIPDNSCEEKMIVFAPLSKPSLNKKEK